MATRKTPTALPQRASWTPCTSTARITAIRKGYTYGRLAELLNERGIRCSEFNVANVVRGFTKRPDLRQGIAEILAIPAERLWPSRRAS